MASTTQTHNLVVPPEERIAVLEQAGGVTSLLAVVGLAGAVGLVWQRRPAWLALLGASFSALAGVLWILRNPERSAPGGHGLVVAPSDGDIRSIDLVQEPRFLKSMAHQVTIRLRSAEVQVTRAPVEGTVRYRRYEPRAEAAELDDSLWIGLRQQEGARVLVRLTASSFWRVMPTFVGRRITALLDLEDAARQGQVTGHLPLGGEVRIYVPATAQLMVRPGLRVRAGETVLARL